MRSLFACKWRLFYALDLYVIIYSLLSNHVEQGQFYGGVVGIGLRFDDPRTGSLRFLIIPIRHAI
jgi:hypothetical protein